MAARDIAFTLVGAVGAVLVLSGTLRLGLTPLRRPNLSAFLFSAASVALGLALLAIALAALPG